MGAFGKSLWMFSWTQPKFWKLKTHISNLAYLSNFKTQLQSSHSWLLLGSWIPKCSPYFSIAQSPFISPHHLPHSVLPGTCDTGAAVGRSNFLPDSTEKAGHLHSLCRLLVGQQTTRQSYNPHPFLSKMLSLRYFETGEGFPCSSIFLNQGSGEKTEKCAWKIRLLWYDFGDASSLKLSNTLFWKCQVHQFRPVWCFGRVI